MAKRIYCRTLRELLGAFVDLVVGALVDLVVGALVDLVVGALVDFKVGDLVDLEEELRTRRELLSVGDFVDLVVGALVDLVVGALVDLVVGALVDLSVGALVDLLVLVDSCLTAPWSALAATMRRAARRKVRNLFILLIWWLEMT
jgi:hypothetical protein